MVCCGGCPFAPRFVAPLAAPLVAGIVFEDVGGGLDGCISVLNHVFEGLRTIWVSEVAARKAARCPWHVLRDWNNSLVELICYFRTVLVDHCGQRGASI